MGFLNELRLRFRPPTIDDPVFGRLVYMHIPRHPARSYWEGEWLFPPTQSKVAVALPGTPSGPLDFGRAFYMALAHRFDRLMDSSRPVLDRVFRDWMGRPLRANVWEDVSLGGFSIDDPAVVPPTWDVTFETVGEKWLGITIPFVGDEPQEPTVDT